VGAVWLVPVWRHGVVSDFGVCDGPGATRDFLGALGEVVLTDFFGVNQDSNFGTNLNGVGIELMYIILFAYKPFYSLTPVLIPGSCVL
jgi:hypothetical protein